MQQDHIGEAPGGTVPEPATSRLEMQDTEVGSVFVSNYPPYSQWTEDAVASFREGLESPPETPAPPLGLYMHIPFCRKRCKFCYYRVYTDKNADEVREYCEALASEIEMYSRLPAIAGRPLRFVYFGGGTPSYIAAKHLRALVDRIRSALSWDDAEEVAFECEPGTLTRSKLQALREIGITRLSLGIENWNDEILRANGRAHESREIHRVLPWIKALEFDQLNVDLIAGMVGETWDTWRESVRRTIECAPDSVTIYQMELPFNTRFSKQYMEGSLDVPLADWAQKREWHLYAIEQLEAAGYKVLTAHVMVRADKPCTFLYTDYLWRGADMLGTGVSAFGHVGGIHAQNSANWARYLASLREGALPLDRAFVTRPEDRLIRETILQLKTGALSRDYFMDRYGVDLGERFATPLRRLAERGMLETSADAITLTRDGLLQVDSFLPEFYSDEYRNARYT